MSNGIGGGVGHEYLPDLHGFSHSTQYVAGSYCA
jgi:hypothetical protein